MSLRVPPDDTGEDMNGAAPLATDEPQESDTNGTTSHDSDNGRTHRIPEWGDVEFVPTRPRRRGLLERIMNSRPVRNIREYAETERRPVPTWVPTAVITLSLTFVATLGTAKYWQGSVDDKLARVAKLEERIQDLSDKNIELTTKVRAMESQAADVAAIKNWTIAVYERADANGWNLPKLPKSVRAE